MQTASFFTHSSTQLGSHRHFWILACLVYMTLIYSTAIHYAFGPEKTISLTFFTWPKENHPTLQEHFPDKGRWIDEDLEDIDSRFIPVNFWKLSSVWGDAGYYVLQADDLDKSIPPFKYRILPTAFIGAIHALTGAPVPIIFAAINCLLTLCTALLFTHFLRRDLGFSDLPSMLGGVLFVTMVANTQTVPLPMLEPMSFLFCVLIFGALYRSDWRMFALAASLGVATKEVLVATSVLWAINAIAEGDRARRNWWVVVCPALVPLIVFVGIRLALGGNALDVNYGYDLLRGEFPLQYVTRLLTPWHAADVLIRLFLAFSFIWVGVVNYRKHMFLSRNVLLVPLVMIATVLLSSRITRIVGILFPIVIPSFLLFLETPRSVSLGTRSAEAM